MMFVQSMQRIASIRKEGEIYLLGEKVSFREIES